MEEILDPLEHQMVQYLSVPEFIKLCQTSSTFAGFCDNPETWTYFIRRDFDEEYEPSENPREDYMIQSKLHDINWSLGEEAYKKIIALSGYGLKEVIPNDRHLSKRNLTKPTSMVTKRFLILVRRIKWYIREIENSIDHLETRLRFLNPHLANKMAQNLVASGILSSDISGQELYDYVEDHKNDPGVELTSLLNKSWKAQWVGKYPFPIGPMELADPVIRNKLQKTTL